MAIQILKLPAVQHRCGLSRSTIYQKISQNDFPAPINLGPRSVGWLEESIDQWLESRIQVGWTKGSKYE